MTKDINIKIDEFWDWFSKNQLTLRDIIKDKYDYIDLILDRLRLIQTGLAVEFELENDVIIMTISADGVEENFNVVSDIMIQAPKIDNWKFIAFRQPVSRDKVDKITVNVHDQKINASMFKFLPITENGFLYIQIFSDLLAENNNKDIKYGCLLLLDNILGEYDCVTKVKGYEFYNTREASDFVGDLRPLNDIKDFLSNYYR